jgi:phosphomethylpyrimidine synthase
LLDCSCDYAAKKPLEAEQAVVKGMEEKAQEFREKGSEIYVK